MRNHRCKPHCQFFARKDGRVSQHPTFASVVHKPDHGRARLLPARAALHAWPWPENGRAKHQPLAKIRF